MQGIKVENSNAGVDSNINLDVDTHLEATALRIIRNGDNVTFFANKCEPEFHGEVQCGKGSNVGAIVYKKSCSIM